jgi:hypothetical protein
VERESALAERERHDKEKADEIKARQIRLGHVPNPDVSAETEEETPTPKAKTTKKTT